MHDQRNQSIRNDITGGASLPFHNGHAIVLSQQRRDLVLMEAEFRASLSIFFAFRLSHTGKHFSDEQSQRLDRPRKRYMQLA